MMSDDAVSEPASYLNNARNPPVKVEENAPHNDLKNPQ